MADAECPGFLMAMVRAPAVPSRRLVAVWRELRRVGALGQGTWAMPKVQAFADGAARAIELAVRGEREAEVMDATGRSGDDAARLAGLFTEAREAEWAESLDDSGKFNAEIEEGMFTGSSRRRKSSR